MLPYQSPVIRQVLDLTKHHFRQRHGDITVYGTWWLGDKEGPWPCLVLTPTFREQEPIRSYRPCVVSIDLAWIWSEEHGDPAYAADTAFSFAQDLGIGETPQNVLRVTSIIREHIADLIKIPPRPSYDHETVGDFIARDQTGRESHIELKDEV